MTRVREATPADRPAVRELQKLLDHRAPALLEAAFDTRASGVAGDVFVVDSGGVVAYALAVPGSREASERASGEAASHEAEPSVVYLAELAVAPGVRREGHASRLIEALAARYHEYDQLRVTVAAGDDGARAFYASAGFWELDELPGRFGDEDGLLLLRGLS